MCRKYTDKFWFLHSHLQHRMEILKTMSILSVSPSLVVFCYHTNRRTCPIIVTVLDNLVVEEIMVFTAGNIPATAQRYKKRF